MKNKTAATPPDCLPLGDIRIYPLSDGTVRLDGGAMFGVVPRVLWERTNPPDEKNRITLGINPVLIETDGALVLVETGMGSRWDEKARAIYGMEGCGKLQKSLSRLGVAPEDIGIVINTHLHFDHAGGNCKADPSGAPVPAFPEARYLVQKAELEASGAPGERSRASYRPEDFMPIKEAGLLDLIDTAPDEETEVAPGVSVFRTSGHNKGIQLVRVDGGGRTAIFLSDIMPTTSHLRYPYIAAYDLFPLDTLAIKKKLVVEAAQKGWFLFFYHDPVVRFATVRLGEKGPELSVVF